jgi:hypothetical protein
MMERVVGMAGAIVGRGELRRSIPHRAESVRACSFPKRCLKGKRMNGELDEQYLLEDLTWQVR